MLSTLPHTAKQAVSEQLRLRQPLAAVLTPKQHEPLLLHTPAPKERETPRKEADSTSARRQQGVLPGNRAAWTASVGV